MSDDIDAGDGEIEEEDDAASEEEATTEAPVVPTAADTTVEAASESNKGPSTSSSLNDEDSKCYSSRYQDIDAMLDPKQHFSSVGITQGRLGTCAKKLTDYEAQRYLN